MLSQSTISVTTINDYNNLRGTLPSSIKVVGLEIQSLSENFAQLEKLFRQAQLVILPNKIHYLTLTKPQHEQNLAQLRVQLQLNLSQMETVNRIMTSLGQSIANIQAKNKKINELFQKNNSLQTNIDRDNSTLALTLTHHHHASARVMPFHQGPSYVMPSMPYLAVMTFPPAHVDLVPHGDHLHQVIHEEDPNEIYRRRISSNQQTIGSNQRMISQLQSSLLEYNPVLQSNSGLQELTTTLNDQKTLLGTLVSEQTNLNTQIETQTHPLRELAKYQADLKTCQLNTTSDGSYSSATFAEVESDANHLSSQMESLTHQIQHKSAEKRRLEETQTDIEKNRLITEPAVLLNDLAKAMTISLLNNFETAYPVNQTAYVRQCLTFLNGKIATLIAQSNSQDITALQCAYYQLYGMIVTFHKNIPVNEAKQPVSAAFKQTLTDLKNRFSLDDRRKLFVGDDECQQYYQGLITNHVYPFAELPTAEINIIEAKNYTEACEKLRSIIVELNFKKHYHISPLAETILSEAEQVLDSLKPAQQQQQKKFLTNMLIKVSNVIDTNIMRTNNPNMDTRIIGLDDFSAFIKHNTHGAPSFYKKFFGAVLALVGTLLTAVCVSAKFMSLGLTTPISTLGIVAGSTTTLLGVGLFRSGMEKRLAASLSKLNTTLNADTDIQAARNRPPAYA